MHPGKRNSQASQAIETDQRDQDTQQGTMQLLNSDPSSISKMEAIISLLLGPLDEVDGEYSIVKLNPLLSQIFSVFAGLKMFF